VELVCFVSRVVYATFSPFAGKTICVLGAPDSGATLLLDLLSERFAPGRTDTLSGEIRWNGQSAIDPYRRSIGYVPIVCLN
jgi:ABC-type multidrug transport system ATPase subunit